MKVIDVWHINGSANGTKARDAAYVELNLRLAGYLAEHGAGKISLLEGDLVAHHCGDFKEGEAAWTPTPAATQWS